jgi:hypothetical protein
MRGTTRGVASRAVVESGSSGLVGALYVVEGKTPSAFPSNYGCLSWHPTRIATGLRINGQRRLQMRKLFVTLLVGVIACAAPASATEADTSRPVAAGSANEIRQALLEAGISRDTKVAVTLRDRSVITGRIDYVGAHSLFVVDSQTGTVTQIAERQLSKLEALGPRGRKGAVIAVAVVGAAVLIAYIAAVSGS